MPKLFCTFNSKSTDSLDLNSRLSSLQGACDQLGVEFCPLDEATVNFSNLPVPTHEDALYNCARGSYLLEGLLLNRDVKTFYRSYQFLSQNDDSNALCFELDRQGITLPKTIYIGTNNKSLLDQYVECVGGFPIVIKTYGGVSGLGVIFVNDYPSLYSTADYLYAKGEKFQIKEFIPSDSCERVVVLGDKVLYTISRPNRGNDFRSDGYSSKAKKIEVSEEVEQLAVRAAHAVNLNFAGIDLITRRSDLKPYVLEVNCPHNFAQHERLTGEDYALKMVKWLFRTSLDR